VRAAVELAGLNADEVAVQVLVGRVDDHDELHAPRATTMEPVGTVDGGTVRYEATVALPAAGVIGYTVRVLPHHDLLASPVELGRVVLAS
jgi:starch phosphorylase